MGTGNAIHVANNTSHTVRVIPAPNKEWLIADVVVGAVTIAIDGVGVITAVSDIWKIWNAFKTSVDVVKEAFAIKEMFVKNGIEIKPGQVVNVEDHGLANDFSPSAWAALCGGSDVNLTIHVDSDDPKQMKLVQFDTNSDYSWIVQDDKVVRAKYGTLRETDEEAGSYDLKMRNV